ncbi:hypothetical protein KC19_2G067600 [Ceratodon purpureus]|uniref:Uncharacterized protein n=1 Tax=Ceratodon purpureus TaxID=3225 RepID=A0A8T0IQX1_CERPU|nr:hypothetical protein KC19_2G067600 [Ceratodon purpureus]
MDSFTVLITTSTITSPRTQLILVENRSKPQYTCTWRESASFQMSLHLHFGNTNVISIRTLQSTLTNLGYTIINQKKKTRQQIALPYFQYTATSHPYNSIHCRR